MLDFQYLLTGRKKTPTVPNLRMGIERVLSFGGLVRGLIVIGKPGSGKTRFAAFTIVAFMEYYPDRGIVILDASGALCDAILEIILSLPEERKQKLLKRIIYDELCHPDYTHTQPEFSPAYGVDMEAQVQRVAENLRRLNDDLVRSNPTLGGIALNEMAPQLFRLLSVIQNQYGENWQITEGKKLLNDPALMTRVLNRFGFRSPESKWYFENIYQNIDMKKGENELRSYTLRSVLGVIEPREVRARVGYYKPTWTPKEVDEKGQVVLVSGERMLDKEPQLNYLFTQIHSLVRQYINTRRPNDPKNKPFLYWIDEAPVLVKVPGMARELGEVSTFYRSRNLYVGIIIQALWQLSDELKEQVWSMGNIVAFGVDDFNDARIIAEQLFHYGPTTVKQPARTQTQNPITEPDHGQYTLFANWLQGLRQRYFVMRRYFDEAKADKYIWYTKTKTVPTLNNLGELIELKERLLKEKGVSVRDALEVINNRKIEPDRKSNDKPQQIS